MSRHVDLRLRILATGSAFMMMLAVNVCLATNTTLWASGVSVGSEATMIANGGPGYARSFDTAIGANLMTLQDSGEVSANSIADFYDSYVVASRDYSVSLKGAADVYEESYARDPNVAGSEYLDNLSHANSAFLTAVGNAKNQMLSELSGSNTMEIRNAFDERYSKASDTFTHDASTVNTALLLHKQA